MITLRESRKNASPRRLEQLAGVQKQMAGYLKELGI